MKINLFNEIYIDIALREAKQERMKFINTLPKEEQNTLLFFENLPDLLFKASLLAQTNNSQMRPLAVRVCEFARSALVSLLIKVRRRR